MEETCDAEIAIINDHQKSMYENMEKDISKYYTWQSFRSQVTFMEESVEKLSSIFEENTFDIIFANRVFHHFVRQTWRKTFSGMVNIMAQISKIIRSDGYLCIMDHFFDGLVFDRSSSKIVYTVSSCKIKPIMNICKKVGIESSGIGVCFLSRKM